MQQRKDLFGHDTQGVNYDTYRPTYPDEAIEKIQFTNNENYIDIAAGTGQLFFKLQNKFTGETRQTLDSLVKYFRTYSAYNTYREKYPEKDDPVDVYEKTILQEYKKLNLKPTNPPMLLASRFFLHILRK